METKASRGVGKSKRTWPPAFSTKTSKVGQAITASLTRQVEVQGGVAIPFGSILKDTIERCIQPTASDQRAELLLSFEQLTIPGQGNLALKWQRRISLWRRRSILSTSATICGCGRRRP